MAAHDDRRATADPGRGPDPLRKNYELQVLHMLADPRHAPIARVRPRLVLQKTQERYNLVDDVEAATDSR